MLKKTLICQLTFLLCSVFCFSAFASPPQNLQIAKENVMRYIRSGEYYYDVEKPINDAKLYLQKRINDKKPKQKLAIVLDVDNTALFGLKEFIKYDFGNIQQYKNEKWNNNRVPLKATLNLYRFAKQNKVSVFFVTARKEIYRKVTVKNLKLAGYNKPDGLYLKPNNYKARSSAPYKTGVRKLLTQQGYNIVLNVGDQYSDLLGGYCEKMVKIPNVIYISP